MHEVGPPSRLRVLATTLVVAAVAVAAGAGTLLLLARWAA